MDKISIIVPIYRIEPYLEQCIQSIRNQTYKNIEIILVDDGSDDCCPQICDYHAQADKRVKVIHKKNGGLDSARKAGMLVASGKYVGYVDGDDWIEPIMYEKLLKYIQMYDVDVVESGVIDSWTNIERKRPPYLPEGCYKDKDFIENVESKILYAGVFFEHGISPYLWCKLFLKEKIMKYQMMQGITNERFNVTMLSLPCIAESRRVYISHDCYYHYRVRNDSLKRECREQEVTKIFTCYPDFYARFKGTRLCSKDDKQIKYYAMYWLLLKAPYIFDNPQSENIMIPFGGIDKKDRVILYGAGVMGIHLYSYIQSIKESRIICWVDRNYEDLQSTLNVKNPKEIKNCEFDYIVIAILRESAVKSAEQDLIDLGVSKEKILWIEQKYIENPELLLSEVKWKGKTLT